MDTGSRSRALAAAGFQQLLNKKIARAKLSHVGAVILKIPKPLNW
ncbi:MAG TPA: hypothetical protein PK671_08730 [Candidatus Obscuribacter sp.]|nr:hypothetical protein [Candidatus Obscuribacter sp.]